MQRRPEIVALLSTVLKHQLTAIGQFFLHARMCRQWGFSGLAEYSRSRSILEMVHAEKTVDRILALQGTPNLADLFPIKTGGSVREQLENDLALAREAVLRLNEAIWVCTDDGTRTLFQEILMNQENHIDYLEGQLHAIQEIGLETYLAQQMVP